LVAWPAMTPRHGDDPGNPHGVGVAELIGRVAGEGLPVRLAWPDDATPAELSAAEWPTGVIPRAVIEAQVPVPALPGDGGESLWGPIGPRPYVPLCDPGWSWWVVRAEDRA
jgi:hypothetical protein